MYQYVYKLLFSQHVKISSELDIHKLKGLSNTRTLASSQPTATSTETQYDHTSSPSSAPFNAVIGGVGGDSDSTVGNIV